MCQILVRGYCYGERYMVSVASYKLPEYDAKLFGAAVQHAAPRRLTILGATGSIGQSVTKVIAANPGRFAVEAVVGGRDGAGLAALAIKLGARHAALYDEAGFADLKAGLSGTGISCACGAEAVIESATRPCDLVIAAIVGTKGIAPTLAALNCGFTVALANKETLVCAGDLVLAQAQKAGAVILPLDSEHNAIFQALAGRPIESIAQMTLTASGGPFLRWSPEAIAKATIAEALHHPKWQMGQKISVDSASLMNKGLELIEAHYLFGIASDRLKVVVHPQSIVHGLISFADGSVIAGLAMPDMCGPVAHCLAYPARIPSGAPALDLAAIGTLSFEAPDEARFPALGLARMALSLKKGLPTILNAANEVAVGAFLAGKISFGTMVACVSESCNRYLQMERGRDPLNLEDALEIHHIGENIARTVLS